MYDLIVFDESECIIKEFCSPFMKHPAETKRMLDTLCAAAKQVIFADADMEGKTVRHIEDLRKRGFEELSAEDKIELNVHSVTELTITEVEDSCGKNLCIVNTYHAMPRKFFITSIIEYFAHAIANLLKQGKNVAVKTHHGPNEIEALAGILRSYCPQKVIHTLHANVDDKATKLTDFEGFWKTSNCLIFSPLVDCGISFDDIHFHHMFGWFNGQTSNAQNCVQGLMRVRKLVDESVFNLICCTSQPHEKQKPATIADIDHHVRSNRQLMLKLGIGTSDNPVVYDRIARFIRTTIGVGAPDLAQLQYSVILENNLNANDWSQCLFQYLHNHGCNVEWYDPPRDWTRDELPDFSPVYARTKVLLREEQCRQIADCAVLDQDELLRLTKKRKRQGIGEELSLEEKQTLDLHFIMQTYKCQETADHLVNEAFIATFGGERGLNAYRRMREFAEHSILRVNSNNLDDFIYDRIDRGIPLREIVTRFAAQQGSADVGKRLQVEASGEIPKLYWLCELIERGPWLSDGVKFLGKEHSASTVEHAINTPTNQDWFVQNADHFSNTFQTYKGSTNLCKCTDGGIVTQICCNVYLTWLRHALKQCFLHLRVDQVRRGKLKNNVFYAITIGKWNHPLIDTSFMAPYTCDMDVMVVDEDEDGDADDDDVLMEQANAVPEVAC